MNPQTLYNPSRDLRLRLQDACNDSCSGECILHLMHAARGQLLFRVNADQQLQRHIWAGVATAAMLPFAYSLFRENRTDSGALILFAGYCLSLLLSRKVIFYKNGIYFPQDTTGGTRAGFIVWRQVERFHWDADVLTVVPTSSLLGRGAGFSGDLSRAASVRVPAGRRVQVENLLSEIRAVRI